MTGAEVLAIRQKLGLPQVELAQRVGVRERTVRNWERYGCPPIAAVLLTKMMEEKEA